MPAPSRSSRWKNRANWAGEGCACALDPEQVEAAVRRSVTSAGRALLWLIYDGRLRCQEALAINIEDVDLTERAIRIQGKGDRTREMFFSHRCLRLVGR